MTCENFNKDIRTEDLVRRIPIFETTTSKIYLIFIYTIQNGTERGTDFDTPERTDEFVDFSIHFSPLLKLTST